MRDFEVELAGIAVPVEREQAGHVGHAGGARGDGRGRNFGADRCVGAVRPLSLGWGKQGWAKQGWAKQGKSEAELCGHASFLAQRLLAGDRENVDRPIMRGEAGGGVKIAVG